MVAELKPASSALLFNWNAVFHGFGRFITERERLYANQLIGAVLRAVGQTDYWVLPLCAEIDMPENFDPERYRRPPEDGPERYAPPHRRPPDVGVANIVQIRAENQASDLLQDLKGSLVKQQPEAPVDTASATENLDVMIRRIAMDSMTEVRRVIRELENVSEMLRNEGERISREVSGYASLNQAATAAMKVIAESLKRPSQNKEAAN